MTLQNGLVSKKSLISPEVEKDVGQLVNNAIGIIYSGSQYQKIVETLKNPAKKPIERISEVVVPIVSHITDAAIKAGVKIGFETLTKSAPIIVSEIMKIAEKEGIFKLDNSEQQAALCLSVQDYMNIEFQKGTYNKNQLATEMHTAIQQLTTEQRQELEKHAQSAQAGIDKQMGVA